jgi:hypothetical protein
MLTAALSALATAPVARASDQQKAMLASYLASASWPVRTSSLRVTTVSDRIEFFFGSGDPPVLGEIAGACKNVTAMRSDPRGSPANLTAPAPLQDAQEGLSRAYSKVEAGCAEARALALRARDAGDRLARNIRNKVPDPVAALDRIVREGGKMLESERLRQYLLHFAPALRSFSETVVQWRSTVLAYSATLRLQPPGWVRQLADQAP